MHKAINPGLAWLMVPGTTPPTGSYGDRCVRWLRLAVPNQSAQCKRVLRPWNSHGCDSLGCPWVGESPQVRRTGPLGALEHGQPAAAGTR
jgi:hypothetical protein